MNKNPFDAMIATIIGVAIFIGTPLLILFCCNELLSYFIHDSIPYTIKTWMTCVGLIVCYRITIADLNKG